MELTKPRMIMAAGASASASVLDAEATVLKKLLIVKTRRKETGSSSAVRKGTTSRTGKLLTEKEVKEWSRFAPEIGHKVDDEVEERGIDDLEER